MFSQEIGGRSWPLPSENCHGGDLSSRKGGRSAGPRVKIYLCITVLWLWNHSAWLGSGIHMIVMKDSWGRGDMGMLRHMKIVAWARWVAFSIWFCIHDLSLTPVTQVALIPYNDPCCCVVMEWVNAKKNTCRTPAVHWPYAGWQKLRERGSGAPRKVRVFYERKDLQHTLFCRET